MLITAFELGLSGKESYTKRWYEHFNEALNRENPSNQVSIAEIEAADKTEEIDTYEATRGEIKEAIKHLRNVPGIDNIRAEMLKTEI